MASAQNDVLLRHIHRFADGPASSAASDKELTDRFANRGDEAAFEALLGRHGSMVLRVCQRVLWNPQDAEDAFQATFLLLARKAHSVRRKESVGSWLYGVAYRVALHARSAAARRAACERQAARHTANDPLTEISLSEAQGALDIELQRLAEKYRAPLVLCWLEGMTRDEAARQLGIPLTTLKSRLERGRQLIRAGLTRRGLTLSAALAVTLLAQGFAQAAVRPLLARCTLHAAISYAVGGAVGPSQPAQVLAEGTLKAISITKLNLVISLVFAAGLAVAGAGLLAAVRHGAGEKSTALEAASTRQVQEQPDLSVSPKSARTDSHGDPLPESAVLRLGTTRFRAGNMVYGMALAPDGKTAVSVGGNSWTQFWDVSSGKETHRIQWKQGGGGRVAAYAPDNRYVATVQDHGPLHLWESASGKHLVELGLKTDWTYSLVFSPDSTLLAAGGSSTKYGRTEQTSSDSVIGLWRWNGVSLQQLWEAKPDHSAPLKGPRSEGIRSLAFSADGKYLASGGLNNNIIRIWNVSGGKEIRQITASGSQIGALAFAPNGKVLVSGCDDGVVALWDPAHGTKLRETKQPGEVRALAFSPEGKVLAVAGGPEYGWNKGKKNEPFVTLLNPADGEGIRRFANIRGGVASLGISKDGQVLAAAFGGIIRLWELPSGRELSINFGHQHWVSEVDISEDGQTAITAGGDGSIILWDLTTGTEKLHLRGHEAEARAVTFVPGGTLVASAGTDQTVRIWDRITGQQLQQFEGSGKGLTYSVAVSSDGRMLAAGDYSDGTIHIWDLTRSKLLHQFKVGDAIGDGAMRVTFSPTGKVLAVAETALNAMKAQFGRRSEAAEARIQLWDAATGNKIREFAAHKYCVKSLAYSPDGGILASTGWSDKGISFWDVPEGKKLFDLPCDSRGGVVRFSRDGRILALGDTNGEINLWETASKKLRRKFQGHISSIHSLVFSPDDKRLVSGSMDTTALVWDVTGLGNAGSQALSENALISLWKALASSDAEEAGRSIWSLAADSPRAVPFLEKRLRNLPIPDSQSISKLVDDLDSQSFTSRETAERKLAVLGKLAVVALRDATARPVSPEVRRRVERLLEGREGPIQVSEAMQALRAIEVLERVGTPAARKVLDDFASQTPQDYFKQEARAASERLAKRLEGNPAR